MGCQKIQYFKTCSFISKLALLSDLFYVSKQNCIILLDRDRFSELVPVCQD